MPRPSRMEKKRRHSPFEFIHTRASVSTPSTSRASSRMPRSRSISKLMLSLWKTYTEGASNAPTQGGRERRLSSFVAHQLAHSRDLRRGFGLVKDETANQSHSGSAGTIDLNVLEMKIESPRLDVRGGSPPELRLG